MSRIESFLIKLILILRDILQKYRIWHLNRQIANNQDLETLGEVKKFKGT